MVLGADFCWVEFLRVLLATKKKYGFSMFVVVLMKSHAHVCQSTLYFVLTDLSLPIQRFTHARDGKWILKVCNFGR